MVWMERVLLGMLPIRCAVLGNVASVEDEAVIEDLVVGAAVGESSGRNEKEKVVLSLIHPA